MFKHYFLVATRNIRRHAGYAILNITGLAVGLAACILIALFVKNEISYDRFHDNSDNLYRAWVFEDYGDAEQFLNTTTPLPLGPALADNYPEVTTFVRVDKSASTVKQDTELIPQNIHIVDSNFFEVFTFPLVYGAQADVLSDASNVVLTQSAALRYFGRSNPIGESILLQNGEDFLTYNVTGIAADPPTESSIQFDIVVPFDTRYYGERMLTAWFNVSPETYVLLREDASVEQLRSKIPELSKMILGDDYKPDVYNIGLQPMPSIHLDTSLPAGSEPISDPQYSFIMGGIALLILLIACINFMTLAIGRSAGRSLEVGVRKVVGAHQSQLRLQFWGEALFMTVLALLAGIILARIALPVFNQLTGRELVMLVNAGNLSFLVGLALIVGLAAGSYPAVLMSGLRPMEVLKGRSGFTGRRRGLQRGMVVFQLCLSVILIVGAIGMQRQLKYLQTKQLGFDKELAVVIPSNLPGPEGRLAADRYREVLSSDPSILNVAASSYNIGDGWGRAGYTDQNDVYRVFWVNIVTPEYLQTLGINITDGSDFNRNAPNDLETGIVVNEALVDEYQWDNPIGQRLPGASFGEHRVIGVVDNFHYSNLKSVVQPLVLMANPGPIFDGIENFDNSSSFSPEITVRIQGDDVQATIARLKEEWSQVAPGQTFEYQFLDDSVDGQYRAEQRLSTVVTLGTMLSILVACLGLYGLATLVTVRRIKEIGIRKTMGASTTKIAVMISQEFAILALIAVVIASPIAFFGLRAWLQEFAYRTGPSASLFVMAAILTLAVTLITVSYHAIRASRIDPVKALKYE